MYEIVRRYTPAVEEYSIDECFADLNRPSAIASYAYPKMAEAIQQDLVRELGMTFSIGLSATKVLAKGRIKWKKPHGLTVIPLRDAHQYLAKIPCIGIWGSGPTPRRICRNSAFALPRTSRAKMTHGCEPISPSRILNCGESSMVKSRSKLNTEARESYQSIQKTKTFTPPSRDPRFRFLATFQNIENACIKARRWNLATREIFFFLKTQDFRYHGYEIKLSYSTCVPQDVLKVVAEYFQKSAIPHAVPRDRHHAYETSRCG